MELHRQAIELLEEMKDSGGGEVSELERRTGIPNVMRPAQWLEEEGLVEIEEERKKSYRITSSGKKALEEGLPEEKVLEKVAGGESSIEQVKSLGDSADLGIGKAREKGLIEIEDGVLHLTGEGEDMLEEEHEEMRVLRTVEEDGGVDDDAAAELLDRGLVEEDEGVKRTVLLTEKGRGIDISGVEEAFDVEVPSKNALVGRKHFAREVYEYIRRVWVEMGFQEMNGPIVVPSLLNFDALYTPQDHPARELHDTFFLDDPEKSDIEPYGSTVGWIKKTHEDGWETGSSGWDYNWSEEESRNNVLRTHTTSVSAKTLWGLEEEDLPAKFFSVDRNFRNETVTWKNIPEFYQTEGIVVGKELNFQHLLGYLEAFFRKLGFEDVRFRPAYYPYTELSIEPDVYDEEKEAWMGMGGAGMFRPEVVKPLLGFEAPVLAWGLGPGRMVMRKHGLGDIRDLYRNDLELLRDAEMEVR